MLHLQLTFTSSLKLSKLVLLQHHSSIFLSTAPLSLAISSFNRQLWSLYYVRSIILHTVDIKQTWFLLPWSLQQSLIRFRPLSLSMPIFLLYSSPNSVCVCVCVCVLCPTLCEPVDCSPPGSSVPGISHARILEWFAMLSSRRSS